MHVHVQSSLGEAKFWIEPEIELAVNSGLPEHEIGKILSLVRRREDEPGSLESTLWKLRSRISRGTASGFFSEIGSFSSALKTSHGSSIPPSRRSFGSKGPRATICTGLSSISISPSTQSNGPKGSRWYQPGAPNIALQRTRCPRVRSFRSLGSPRSPLTRRPLAGRRRSVAIGLALIAFAVGCRFGEGRLARRIKSAASHPNAIIRFTDFTDFTWDRVCLFGPYTTKEEAEGCLGFVWDEFEDTGIDMADQFSVMAFAASGRVVHAERISRNLDFTGAILRRPFRPSEAVFKVGKTEFGHHALVPVDNRAGVPVDNRAG